MRRIIFCAALLLASLQARAQGVADGGFTARYFPNATWSGTPAFQRRDVRIDMAWHGAQPGGSTDPAIAAVPGTGFSVRWSGRLIPALGGTYTFTTKTAGPVRVWLTPAGGTQSQIIHAAGPGLTTQQGQAVLQAGQPYDLIMDYADPSAPAEASLSWSTAGLRSQIIGPVIPLGVNLTGLADWDGGRMFADAMRQSRGWRSVANWQDMAPADQAGWPTSDFLAIPIAGPPRLDGTYLIQFTGQAQVDVQFGYGSFAVGGQAYGGTLPAGIGYDPATNATTANMTITPTEGVNLFINFTNTQRTPSSAVGSGLTGIRMMRPLSPGATQSFAPGVVFNAALEHDVAGFTTLRAMDYLAENGTTIRHWSDRPLPSLPIQATAEGGALEYAVMFANETGKDLWLNIPVAADETYVRDLALLLRYGSDGVNPYTRRQAAPVFPPLQPHLKVYLEYSNEVWNSEFPQFGTNLALANAEVAGGHSPLNYDRVNNQWYWAWRRVALRIKEISDTFRAVWGAAAIGTQIRPVLEWQGDDGQDTADQQLNFLADYYGNADGLAHVAAPRPVSAYLWGAGAAWYHSVQNASASTIDRIYASGLVLPTSVPTDATWAKAFGLPEAAYEGGFEIGGDNPSALQLKADIDSRAQADMASGLDYFFAQGGGLGMIYTIAGQSAYGLANPTVYSANTPKLKAVAALTAAALPASALGNAVSGAASLPVATADIAHNLWGPWTGTVYVGSLQWLNWTIRVATAGSYAVTTNLGVVPGQTLIVDGTAIGNSGARVALSSGWHSIRVRNLGPGALAITALRLKLL